MNVLFQHVNFLSQHVLTVSTYKCSLSQPTNVNLPGIVSTYKINVKVPWLLVQPSNVNLLSQPTNINLLSEPTNINLLSEPTSVNLLSQPINVILLS